jgi:hypothetical protein
LILIRCHVVQEFRSLGLSERGLVWEGSGRRRVWEGLGTVWEWLKRLWKGRGLEYKGLERLGRGVW